MDSTYNLNGGFKPTIKRFADLDGPDFYPTPPWATYALAENEPFQGNVWECACGDGAMSRVFKDVGLGVSSSDLYDRGYGEIGHDFLTTNRREKKYSNKPTLSQRRGVCCNCTQASGQEICFTLASCISRRSKSCPDNFSEGAT